MATLYVGNDMRLVLQGRGRLKDERGSPVTGATVEATLYEAGGVTEVEGVDWPITLTESGEDGEYSGIIPTPDADVSVNKSYVLTITATAPGGARAAWRESVDVQYRDF
mgnify:CR=1 FL=1